MAITSMLRLALATVLCFVAGHLHSAPLVAGIEISRSLRHHDQGEAVAAAGALVALDAEGKKKKAELAVHVGVRALASDAFTAWNTAATGAATSGGQKFILLARLLKRVFPGVYSGVGQFRTPTGKVVEIAGPRDFGSHMGRPNPRHDPASGINMISRAAGAGGVASSYDVDTAYDWTGANIKINGVSLFRVGVRGGPTVLANVIKAATDDSSFQPLRDYIKDPPLKATFVGLVQGAFRKDGDYYGISPKPLAGELHFHYVGGNLHFKAPGRINVYQPDFRIAARDDFDAFLRSVQGAAWRPRLAPIVATLPRAIQPRDQSP